MKYQIRHTTSYQYEDLVVGSHHSAHLCPRQLPLQQVSDYRCVVTPIPSHHAQHSDFYGNMVEDIHIQIPHQTLTVCAESCVEVMRPVLSDNLDGERNPAWEQWAEACRSEWALQEYLEPTALSPYLHDIANWARGLFAPGQGIFDCVSQITAAINHQFAYAPGSTDVDTTIAEVFAQRSGVCQDFAHLMTSALRALGIPARYVSGYLETLPPPGQTRLVGADASHAWVGVYLPGYGWVDYDPTNNCIVGNHHITVAWGRDYADVPPLKGIIQGGGEHQVQVAVDVVRSD